MHVMTNSPYGIYFLLSNTRSSYYYNTTHILYLLLIIIIIIIITPAILLVKWVYPISLIPMQLSIVQFPSPSSLLL